eukprot:244408-Rhodomonas_salina.1
MGRRLVSRVSCGCTWAPAHISCMYDPACCSDVSDRPNSLEKKQELLLLSSGLSVTTAELCQREPFFQKHEMDVPEFRQIRLAIENADIVYGEPLPHTVCPQAQPPCI